MKPLIPKPTGSYYGRPWLDIKNGYVVLDAGQVVGRTMLHLQAPGGHPWFWTITVRAFPPSIHNRGYSATREQAMASFKSRWLS
jgi:hypothetical protein